MPLALSSLPLLRRCDNAVVFVEGGVPLFHERLLSHRAEGRSEREGGGAFEEVPSLCFFVAGGAAAKLLCRFEAVGGVHKCGGCKDLQGPGKIMPGGGIASGAKGTQVQSGVGIRESPFQHFCKRFTTRSSTEIARYIESLVRKGAGLLGCAGSRVRRW